MSSEDVGESEYSAMRGDATSPSSKSLRLWVPSRFCCLLVSGALWVLFWLLLVYYWWLSTLSAKLLFELEELPPPPSFDWLNMTPLFY
jgi:hypothetical protein